jgi:hypothetical protein
MTPLIMNVPDAKEARKKIDEGNYEKAKKLSVEMSEQINSAIARGQYCLSVSHVEPVIKKLLEEKGYKLEYFGSTRRGEDSSWIISW